MTNLGTGNLLMPNLTKERHNVIGEMVMASPNPIPPNATLLDNGASVNVMKTLTGAILATYLPEEPGDGISVGDENAELQSNGSYVYANRYTDCNGAQVVMLIRACYCPGVICNIISEPQLVYQEKCSITFGGNGRIITMSDGKKLCLSMTSNGLGWLKSDPITDDATVLAMLERKGGVVASISMRGSTQNATLEGTGRGTPLQACPRASVLAGTSNSDGQQGAHSEAAPAERRDDVRGDALLQQRPLQDQHALHLLVTGLLLGAPRGARQQVQGARKAGGILRTVARAIGGGEEGGEEGGEGEVLT